MRSLRSIHFGLRLAALGLCVKNSRVIVEIRGKIPAKMCGSDEWQGDPCCSTGNIKSTLIWFDLLCGKNSIFNV
jgi:hypothetical protein